MKLRSIKLTEQQEAALRKAAEARGVSDSAIVREALDVYLAGQVATSKRRSVADVAAHLVGVVKDAPADLSTNPKYFKGFGQ
jgi:hypothetical protein